MLARLSSTLLVASLASLASAGKIDDIINSLKLPLSSEKYQRDLTTSALKFHAQKFQSFADKNNGTRVFGSPGYNASVGE